MAEWLYEAGVGESRAALVADGDILEMVVEWDDAPGLRIGAVRAARLTRKADASGRGQVSLPDGSTAQIVPVPAGITEGAALVVEVVREMIREGNETKPLRVRLAANGASIGDGPGLRERIACSGHPVRDLRRADDELDRHGWSEALEEAASGVAMTRDVMLRIALTPAMTLIDVDGAGSAADLAKAGARAAGEIIRRFGIAGSIGVDLPTMASKSDRQAAAAALDAALPQPFERTAVNGFGFLQIVRRRERMSLMEQLASDPVRAAAGDLLRRCERASGHGRLTAYANPKVIARIAARPDWIDMLQQRLGASVALQADERLAISGGHASRSQN